MRQGTTSTPAPAAMTNSPLLGGRSFPSFSRVPSGKMSSVSPFLHFSTVCSMAAISSFVPRTHTAPQQRKNHVSRALISNSSFLANTIIRLPHRVTTMNTGSMAETWVGARMQPFVCTFFRFSRPSTWMRKPICHKSHAKGTKM